MAEVTVYTTPTCPWCGRVKDFLDQRGVTYQEINVAVDEVAAKELVEKTGQRSVPVITRGPRYVVGFDPEQLDRILQ